MPSIKEIADACGVTKPTVTAKLKELDLWDKHVSKSGKAYEVSAEASSIVSSALKPSVTPVAEEKKVSSSETIYEAYIANLKRENERLWGQVEEKDKLIAELSRKLADNQQKKPFWSRLLPSGKVDRD